MPRERRGSRPSGEFVIELLDRAVSGMGGQSRDGQHEMARQVAQAIDSGDHLLVQAGTGTGKSLAYLIPLIAHSLVSDKPTLVSTATLALQTQIVGRDLPRLLKTITPALDRPVKVALVKGRVQLRVPAQARRRLPLGRALRGPALLPRRGHQPCRTSPRPWAARPPSSARKWSGCANGPRTPPRGTATNSCPASRTGPGGRSPSPPWNASARRSAPWRPNASANWPGRTPPTPTSWSPTTPCWPSAPSRAWPCCRSTTSWWWMKPTSSRTA